jgi:hypothetical protein
MVTVYLSSHVVLTSHMTSRTILFELSKETLFSIATIVALQVSPCILPRTLMTLVNHQGRSNTQDSIVHFYAMSVWPPGDFVYLSYSIIQENVTSAHTEESPPPFQLSSCPYCYTVNASFIVSCASPPSFHKSWDKFSFKRGDCNAPCYNSPNSSLINVITGLVMHSCLS